MGSIDLRGNVRQQALEIGVRRFPLFAPLKQRAVDGVIGAQLLHQSLNILRVEAPSLERSQSQVS